jgi:hypothetical protein
VSLDAGGVVVLPVVPLVEGKRRGLDRRDRVPRRSKRAADGERKVGPLPTTPCSEAVAQFSAPTSPIPGRSTSTVRTCRRWKRGWISVNRSSDSTRDSTAGIAAAAGPTAWPPSLSDPIRSPRRAAGRRGRSTPGFGLGSTTATPAAPPPPEAPAPTGSRTNTSDPPGANPGSELRTRRHQVITDPHAEPPELLGHHRTDRVHSGVIGAGVAAAVAMEPRHRIGTAALQLATQHVACHVPMVSSRLRAGTATSMPAPPSPGLLQNLHSLAEPGAEPADQKITARCRPMRIATSHLL